jgi:hypothetical protein
LPWHTTKTRTINPSFDRGGCRPTASTWTHACCPALAADVDARQGCLVQGP